MTNDSETYLRTIAAPPFGSLHAKFILAHGQAFEPDALTFKGWRGTPKNCFGNSATYALTKDPTLTYVEGYVSTLIPIHHAWLMRDDGTIIDPTLRLNDRFANPHAYFGVPFDSDFLRRFLLKTKTFGLLDGMSKESIALMLRGKPKQFSPKWRTAA